MVHELIYPSFQCSLFEKEQLLEKIVLKLFTTFILFAAILASPKHRDFTWSYHSSIYRVHWFPFKKLLRNREHFNFRGEVCEKRKVAWEHEHEVRVSKVFPFTR